MTSNQKPSAPKFISKVPNAPEAIGPYSPAVIANGFAFVSGQIPLDPASGVLVGEDVTAQTHQVLANLEAILTALDADFSRIVKTTIFLTDLKDFQTVNDIYGTKFTATKPARSTIQVAALPKAAKVEIEAIVAL